MVNIKSEFQTPHLDGADLRGARLEGADLRWVHFSGVNMTNARLDGADLRDADFSEAIFDRASLKGCNAINAEFRSAMFRGTDLSNVDFERATLCEALFSQCTLNNSNWRGALLGGAQFLDVDLSEVLGLKTVVQHIPTSIGVDSIYRLEEFSESFLRDAGVPEEFIRFIPSLIASQEGIQFYSCFISFSFKDQEFADRLHGRLRDSKLRVWYAPEDMQAGQKTHEQIETAIRMFDKLLVVLSDASLASEWVRTEIRKARAHERKTGKRKLFPVRLVDFNTLREWECFDADSGKDLGVELREYYIPDFSTWKDHDKFEVEFKKLLRDLKADASPSSP